VSEKSFVQNGKQRKEIATEPSLSDFSPFYSSTPKKHFVSKKELVQSDAS
jgi:hypothetical protein